MTENLDLFGDIVPTDEKLVKTLLDSDEWNGSSADEFLLSTLHAQELEKNLKAFLEQVPQSLGMPIGQVQHAIYAFFDIEGEPLYVGQTKENVSTRLGRHLRGQRSDCVAKRILDPLEIFFVKVWPLPQYQNESSTEAKRHINALEYLVFQKAVLDSRSGFVLNEKAVKKPDSEVPIPESFMVQLLSDSVAKQVLHPDVRNARYAQCVSELAQIPSQRTTDFDLRKILQYKAERFAHLVTVRNRKLAALMS